MGGDGNVWACRAGVFSFGPEPAAVCACEGEGTHKGRSYELARAVYPMHRALCCCDCRGSTGHALPWSGEGVIRAGVPARPKENPRPIIHGPHSLCVRGRNQTRRLRRRREFKTTEIEDAVIANAANMGLMRMPKKG